MIQRCISCGRSVEIPAAVGDFGWFCDLLCAQAEIGTKGIKQRKAYNRQDTVGVKEKMNYAALFGTPISEAIAHTPEAFRFDPPGSYTTRGMEVLNGWKYQGRRKNQIPL